jgi:ElaB/YqjD/DUF883 family membrane-anchored ribosome-binding protein
VKKEKDNIVFPSILQSTSITKTFRATSNAHMEYHERRRKGVIMTKATSKKINKQIRKITRKATKKINKVTKQNPAATVAITAAVATTSVVGVGTIITNIIRLPGAVKRRFAKVNLGDTNNINNDTTNNTDADNNADNTDADNNNNDDNTDADNTDEE